MRNVISYQLAVKSTTTKRIPAAVSSAWKWLSSLITRTLIFLLSSGYLFGRGKFTKFANPITIEENYQHKLMTGYFVLITLKVTIRQLKCNRFVVNVTNIS